MADKLIIRDDGALTWDTGEIFKGSLVPQDKIEFLWEDLRKYLKEKGYSTQFAEMPKIRATIVDSTTFKRVSRVVDGLPAEKLENAGKEDRSKYVAKACKLVVVGKNGSESHLIVMPKSDIPEYIDNMTHELLHVWEDILLLYPGTLTEDFERSIK